MESPNKPYIIQYEKAAKACAVEAKRLVEARDSDRAGAVLQLAQAAEIFNRQAVNNQ